MLPTDRPASSQFLGNKDDIVQDVLKKLRGFARVEAELLFKEYRNYPGALPHFSGLISDTINTATDAVRDEVDKLPAEDRSKLVSLFRDHLPAKMAAMAEDRLESNVPPQYLVAAIASSLASKIVYSEGVNFVRSQPPENLSKIALRFIEAEAEVADLERSLEGAQGMDEADKEKALGLIRKGGVRSLLDIF